jgi:stage II sporulation protein AB (anti-sigma F factor)
MKIEFESKTNNISFARVSIAAFLTQLNPTLEEIADVKTAVSEAVTNAMIHGYDQVDGMVEISTVLEGSQATIVVRDKGNGIDDVKRAMEPMYTTKSSSEHSGMGFMFMQAFMDEVLVESEVGVGTTITMMKRIGCENT